MSFPGGVRQLLHIGAGDGAEVAAWQAAGVTRLLLAEADPDTARALARRAGVEVVAGAVSGDPEPRAFRRCNLPALSSFRAPEGLAELFPGLRLLAAEETVPLDPCTLAARLDDTPAALVIEAPGEALRILQALEAGGMLDRFTAIRLQEGRAPLYSGAPSAEVIRDWLDQAGFETEFEPAPEDPDRPHLFARRDPARGALAEAVARGDALEAERDALRAAMETLRAELGETRAEAEAARDAALAEAAELRAGATALTAEAETLRHQLAQAWQRVDERQKDLTLAQQNLAVALRIQTLREADLGELQARHGALLARVEQQDALLARLAAEVEGRSGGKDGKRRKSRDD